MRDEPARDASKDAPYFFLSYAHTPRHGRGKAADPDLWTATLFRDLCNNIRSLAALPPDAKVGFMDHELWRGHDWPIGLARALATCRVFVPLYSRRYFESEHCGKEWSAFSRRMQNHAVGGIGRSEAIIPALWVPVEQERLPSAARSINFPHAELGEQYARLGFYGIMKLSRYRADYEKAVLGLTQRIVAAAASSFIGPDLDVDYNTLQSAFGAEVGEMPGDQRLRITVVAPRRDELPDGRGAAHYGAAALDWNPYWPESSRVLADYVADLVRSLGYRPDVGDAREHGAELLSGGPPFAPEVLIVDPWATRREEYHDLLQRLDGLGKPWVQVLVPWNRRDKESEVAEQELRDALESALRRKLAEGRATSWLAVHGVPTLEDLARELPSVIMTARRQYLRHARAFPPDGDAVERPRLSMVMTDPVEMEFPGG